MVHLPFCQSDEAVQAVDVGQMEAARSVGFSHGQAMRLVVLPQAIKNILPAGSVKPTMGSP